MSEVQQQQTINANVANDQPQPNDSQDTKRIRVCRRARQSADSWLSVLSDFGDQIHIGVKANIVSAKREVAIRDLNERINFQKDLNKVKTDLAKLNNDKITDISSLIKETDRDMDAVLKSIL